MSTSNLVGPLVIALARMPSMTIAKNLTRLRSKAGLSQSALAKLSGVSQQLISQIERGENVSTRHLPKLANALGVGIGEIDPSYVGPAPNVRMVKVVGFVQAGHYDEAWELPEEDIYEVPIPADPRLHNYSLLAVETRGTSMNRRYPEGTILVFSSAIQTHEDLKPGRRYIIERERADGTREATVKLLWLDKGGKPWLLPESDDPLFQAPIALDGDEGDTIRVLGQVRFSVARED